jgi:hypothetical protein
MTFCMVFHVFNLAFFPLGFFQGLLLSQPSGYLAGCNTLSLSRPAEPSCCRSTAWTGLDWFDRPRFGLAG